jgi:pilus assembly protein CpaB
MIHFTKILAGLLVLTALALGGWAWWLARQPARIVAPVAAPATNAARETTYAVVVTSRAVSAGEVLTAASLRVEQLPIALAGALQDVTSAAGRVAVVDLAEGAPLTEGQLASGLALRLGEGERAVAVKADELMGVGSRVRPGDFVDVFFVIKAEGREIERSQARLLLSRQRVLAFGTASVDGGPPAEGKGGAPRPEAARTAVLAVAVQDVPQLALGDSSGRLLLALRHPGDHGSPDPRLFAELPPAIAPLAVRSGQGSQTALAGLDRAQGGVALPDLANGSAVRAPAVLVRVAAPGTADTRKAAPASPRPFRDVTEVEVFRADKRETLSY